MPLSREERHALAARIRLGEVDPDSCNPEYPFWDWHIQIKGHCFATVLKVPILYFYGQSSYAGSYARGSYTWEDGTETSYVQLVNKVRERVLEYLEK